MWKESKRDQFEMNQFKEIYRETLRRRGGEHDGERGEVGSTVEGKVEENLRKNDIGFRIHVEKRMQGKVKGPF